MEKGGIVMDISIRIAFLESRLHRLSTRKGRDNAGVCRKISREIRNLKKKRQSENLVTENYALANKGSDAAGIGVASLVPLLM